MIGPALRAPVVGFNNGGQKRPPLLFSTGSGHY